MLSPIEIEVLKTKLAVITENLKALEPIRSMGLEAYEQDLYKRKATERLLQEMIEAAIDTNLHWIVGSGHAAPDDYFQSFIRAGELGMIPVELAQNLAPSAGLRNRLVHEYDNRLDQAIIRQAVERAAAYYPLYVQEVYSRLTALIRQEI